MEAVQTTIQNPSRPVTQRARGAPAMIPQAALDGPAARVGRSGCA